MLSLTLYKTENDIEHEYSIHDLELSLFDLYHMTVVSRINGRIQKEKKYTFKSLIEKDKKIHELFMTKIKAGYQVQHGLPREIDHLDQLHVM